MLNILSLFPQKNLTEKDFVKMSISILWQRRKKLSIQQLFHSHNITKLDHLTVNHFASIDLLVLFSKKFLNIHEDFLKKG